MVSTLPSFCRSYKIQDKEATVTVLAVLAVVAVSVVTATPLKTQPHFSVILNWGSVVALEALRNHF